MSVSAPSPPVSVSAPAPPLQDVVLVVACQGVVVARADQVVDTAKRVAFSPTVRDSGRVVAKVDGDPFIRACVAHPIEARRACEAVGSGGCQDTGCPRYHRPPLSVGRQRVRTQEILVSMLPSLRV